MVSNETSNGIELDDWLLTESVRRHEQRLGRWRDDDAAMTLAREAPDAFDRRLAARARALPSLGRISRDLQTLARHARRFLLGVCLLGIFTGWLAARASAADRQLDLLLASLTLIGLPTLLLLAWLLVWSLSGRRSRSHGGLLSGLAARLLSWLGPRILNSPLAAELAQSAASFLPTAAGRWWLSLASHLLWLGFSVGAIVGLALHFSVAQYDLSWGTTILSEQTVAGLIQALAWLPQQLGFGPVLTVEFIERARVGGLAGADRAIWAQFLMLMVVLYVGVPRLLLVLLALVRFRTTSRSMPLLLGEPGYLRLRPELMPELGGGRVMGEAPNQAPAREQRVRPTRAGRPVMVGFELDSDLDVRLATGLERDVVYLGPANRRSERQALIEALDAMRPPPSDLIVVCSLLRTPDAGTARFICRLADAARAALIVLAVDSKALEQRGGDLKARERDWQRLASHIGGQFKLLQDAPGSDEARASILAVIQVSDAQASDDQAPENTSSNGPA